MFRRSQAKTRAQLMRAELGETFDHARRAAGHAAGGMRTTVGPRVAPAADRFRSAAANGWGTTRSAVHEAQQKSRRKQQRAARRRWSWLAGMLASGAALGGAAAYLARRRQREEWEAYGATSAAADSPTGAGSPTTGGGDELLRETGAAAPDGRT